MDNNWKKRFENAEVTPPDALWANIESGLAAPGSARPWIFTTVGIAATVSLLFAASIVTYFVLQKPADPSSTEIVQSNEPVLEHAEDNGVKPIPTIKETKSNQVANSLAKTEKEQTDEFIAQPSQALKVKTEQTFAQVTAEPDNLISPFIQDNTVKTIAQVDSLEAKSFEDQVGNNSSAIAQLEDSSKAKVNNVAVLNPTIEELPTLEDLREIKKGKKSKSGNRLWAGVYQGVGGYASNISGGSNNALNAVDGESFSLGGAIASEQSSVRSIDEKQVVNTALLVGVPLADKLSIVSGFQYSKSSFTSSAGSIDNQLLHFTTTQRQFDSFDDATFQRTDLDGFYEMATIPLMADYQIVSQRFSWSVQAGPAIGLLIRQKIVSDELGLSQTTQPGDLYSPVHFRVGIGSSISYQIGDNYQVSLRPAVDQAVTSITTSSASFSSYPLNYFISLGLLYQF